MIHNCTNNIFSAMSLEKEVGNKVKEDIVRNEFHVPSSVTKYI